MFCICMATLISLSSLSAYAELHQRVLAFTAVPLQPLGCQTISNLPHVTTSVLLEGKMKFLCGYI